MKCTLVITCEHAGNKVPKAFQALFSNHLDALNSHRGWDPGAWSIAIELARDFGIEALGEHTTRLLIEPNRSLDSHDLYSSYSSSLSAEEKESLLQNVYLPYRRKVEAAIHDAPKPVLHLSIHTFTPIFNNIHRMVDIGILFDPARKMESTFSQLLLESIEHQLPTISTRFNEPYLGIDDGFTTHLRKKYPGEEYMGIEIEVNQKFLQQMDIITSCLTRALQSAIASIH